jgi:hypothetical protein
VQLILTHVLSYKFQPLWLVERRQRVKWIWNNVNPEGGGAQVETSRQSCQLLRFNFSTISSADKFSFSFAFRSTLKFVTFHPAMDPDDGSNADCGFGRAKQKRPVVRHARSFTRVLKEWFAAHPLWPYRTEQEKEALSERTGMTIRQV